MPELNFSSIYWSPNFDWETYARLYDDYCDSADNYYLKTAKAVIDSISIPDAEDAVCVDIGCGTGIATRLLLERYRFLKVIGIDKSEVALSYYRKNFSGEIATGRVSEICLSAEDVDKVSCQEPILASVVTSALPHIEITPFLERLSTRLHPGGMVYANIMSIFFGEPSGLLFEIESLLQDYHLDLPTYQSTSKNELLNTLKKSGFSMRQIKPYSFELSKESFRSFLNLYLLRIPFIYFSDSNDYQMVGERCTEILSTLAESTSYKPIETGYVIEMSVADI